MFARTKRLLLRPGFPEDAPALAAAMSDAAIARNLSVVPWPYTLRDAEAFLASPKDPVLPSLLIFERADAEPRLIGSCGLSRRPSGALKLDTGLHAHSGVAALRPSPVVRSSTSRERCASASSRPRTSSITRRQRESSTSSASNRPA